MSVDLPTPIAAYFATDNHDGETASRCFTEHAVVRDEGRTHTGRTAIAAWKTAAAAKYNYTSAPFAVEHKDGKTVVTSHVAGNFPGSPIDLRYFFVLADGKIAFLEIIP